jgi:hypothetical protein
MKKRKVAGLLKGLSTKELQELIGTNNELDILQGKKKALEKQLASVIKQINSLESSVIKIGKKKQAVRVRKEGKKVARQSVRKTGRKRIVQPSVSSLIVEILKANKQPMKINDIHDALLREKKYKTQAKNFKANVRILLYKNDKGLFKKVGPGKFGLAKGKKAKSKKK